MYFFPLSKFVEVLQKFFDNIQQQQKILNKYESHILVLLLLKGHATSFTHHSSSCDYYGSGEGFLKFD